MDGSVTPASGAKARYAKSFASNIFEPPERPVAARGPNVPAGKRRDQTTSELFGTFDGKDLRSVPKTFVPKEGTLTARQMKLQFLKSGQLPGSEIPQGSAAEHPLTPLQAQPTYWWAQQRQARDRSPGREDEQVRASVRRQSELSSNLFDRATPEISADVANHRDRRLLPADFDWSSCPEPSQPSGRQALNHMDRAYQQKCSAVLNYTSPQTLEDNREVFRMAREEDSVAESLRRHNRNYSDLFGRRAPGEGGRESMGRLRAPEDQIIVHQDWTDCRTELLKGSRGAAADRAAHIGSPLRLKSGELHHSQIFSSTPRDSVAGDEVPILHRAESVAHDNSDKLKRAVGLPTQQIHQAHLRSTLASDTFYEDAQSTQEWEVAELFMSGLPRSTDEVSIRRLCRGFDLQVVKAVIEFDTVTGLCKGRAKIVLRYSPKRESVQALARHLEASGIKLDM